MKDGYKADNICIDFIMDLSLVFLYNIGHDNLCTL